MKALSAAKAIMKDVDFVDVDYILEELDCEPENLDEALTYIDPNWYNSMLLRIK